MGLMENANGIGDDGYSSYKPFEPGEYIVQCILDPEKNMTVNVNRYEKEDGVFYGLKCAWQIQAKANGEEVGGYTIFKFYWNLEQNKDFVAMLKYTGLLEEIIKTFGNEPDYNQPEVEQFLSMRLPGKTMIADVFERDAKPYTDKEGNTKEGKPQKDFNKIRPLVNTASTDSGPDFSEV